MPEPELVTTLIVDDNPDLAALLREMLADAADRSVTYDVVMASSLTEAREGVADGSISPYGQKLLREHDPNTFASLIERYAGLVRLALGQQGSRGDHHLPDHLRRLARELGDLRCSARDVIDLHLASVAAVTTSGSSTRQSAVLDEARVLVLELMGHLVGRYRQQGLGLTAVTDDRSATDHAPEEPR